MLNSIITTVRDRPLDLFLSSLIRWPRNEDHELIIVGDVPAPRQVLLDNLQINSIPFSCGPAFHKTKALNIGIREAKGQYITTFDADCWFPCNPFAKIEEIAESEDWNLKHGWRVKYLTKYQTEELTAHREITLEPNAMEAYIENRGMLTGNSHYTLLTDSVIELGGYDEEFVGWGHEDLEANARYYQRFGPCQMIDGHDLWHTYHRARIDHQENRENLRRINQREREGWPAPQQGIKTPCPPSVAPETS